MTVSERPVLVAQRVVGGNNNVAMLIDASRDGADTTASAAAPAKADAGNDGATGTTGRDATPGASATTGRPLTSLDDLSSGGMDLIGRQVRLDRVKVERVAKDGGFFVAGSGSAVYVLPNDRQQGATVQQGDMVTIGGRVLELPDAKARQMTQAPDGHAHVNDDLYILATRVQK